MDETILTPAEKMERVVERLTRERDEARAAITAALDESTATKVLKLRIEELNGRVGELEGDRNYAYRVKHELEAEVERLNGLFISTCESRDAWIKQCDKATDEVKRLEERNLHNVTAYSQELTQRTTELQRAEAEVTRLRDSMVRHVQEEHLAGDGPEIDRWKREVKRLEGLILAWRVASSTGNSHEYQLAAEALGGEGARIRAQREEGQHFKHPTGDYCVWCHSQWPCEEGR